MISAMGGFIMRVARIMVISAGIFLLAWVIKEVMYQGDAEKADAFITKIRTNGM
jgi:hypothetical protein